MNKRFKDLTGKSVGRLEAIEPLEERAKDGIIIWKCRCICGTIINVRGDNFRNGRVKSCGCLRKELYGKQVRTHGLSKAPLYQCWMNMNRRCYDSESVGYCDYGARGIKVCERWKNSVENFIQDMGERPVNLTLERIDNNGDYCPENCRWTTMQEQSKNKRNNKILKFNNKEQCLNAWAKEIKISSTLLWQRLYKFGWSLEKALTTPVRKQKKN